MFLQLYSEKPSWEEIQLSTGGAHGDGQGDGLLLSRNDGSLEPRPGRRAVVTANWLRFKSSSVSSCNLSDFDVACEIAGNARVTNRKEETCTWQHKFSSLKSSIRHA